MFKCYTGDHDLFDIFQLIIDMHNLRGKEISLRQALAFCGLETSEAIEENKYYGVKKQLDYLYKVGDKHAEEPTELEEYPAGILNRYIFDLDNLKPWINEGIGAETLRKYDIKFDPIANAIIIPYFTPDFKLVGVRGRFLSPESYAKYMPMKYGDKFLVHPISKILYGLNINKEAIKEHQTVIIFEGEKSVMKMDTLLGKDNISVAVSGRTLSKEHVKLLLDNNVKNIILAFDRDYQSHNEIKEEIEDFNRKLSYAKNFFNISLIIDYDFVLSHKNSPIDQGKQIFDDLMAKRVFI
jgi:5S rRNA maturation endonuclease (ribonuclease M5)